MSAEWPRHLTATERAALADFLERARSLLGGDLLSALLFGSRARGEGGEGSDLDVALVVTPAGRRRRRDLHGLTFDVALAHGVELEPLVITEERLGELARRERKLAADLAREGVPL